MSCHILALSFTGCSCQQSTPTCLPAQPARVPPMAINAHSEVGLWRSCGFATVDSDESFTIAGPQAFYVMPVFPLSGLFYDGH